MTCKVCGSLLVNKSKQGMCISCWEGRQAAARLSRQLQQYEDDPESRPQTIIRTYSGKKKSVAIRRFRREAERLSEYGYVPVSQSYQPGKWGCGQFLIGVLLAFILIGLIVLVYMLLVPPPGVLTVTYRLTDQPAAPADPGETKVCPDCAEEVKAAAKVCRFCRYRFDEDESEAP